MKTKLIYTLLLSTSVLFTNAQSSSDALNFSQTFNAGTARFTSMGGAFGALGGDFSSIGINPAGLGVYRSSEFSFTPSFKKRDISSAYNGNNESDSRNRLGIDNIGFIFSYKPNGDDETGLINFNVAIGYNKTNDFHSNSLAIGNNLNNSIMDYFVGKANTVNRYYIDDLLDDEDKFPFFKIAPPNDWDIVMAWNTMLLYDTIPGTGGTQYSNILLPGDAVTQKNIIETGGSSGEYLLSFATNFSNKFYIGASLGINSFNYSNITTFSEDAFSDNGRHSNGDRFYYSDYIQNYEINGTGYNFKIGMIYKPIEMLRLGLSFHSPTYFNLEDTYSYSMKVNLDVANVETNFLSESPAGKFEYRFETPLKLIGSAAFIFKNKGLLSVDIERINYEDMRYSSAGDGSSFFDTNQGLKEVYTNVTNLKVGGEIKLNDFSIRGGYAYYPSPYKNGYLNDKANRTIISGGLGYRTGNIYVDAAYQYSIQNGKYVFYDIYNTNYDITTNPIETKLTEGKFLLTVGVKF